MVMITSRIIMQVITIMGVRVVLHVHLTLAASYASFVRLACSSLNSMGRILLFCGVDYRREEILKLAVNLELC